MSPLNVTTPIDCVAGTRRRTAGSGSPFEHGNVAVSAMTPTQSKRLKTGQRVAWHDSADDQGTVSASDWSGVLIEWDYGKNQFFHHNNMDEVEVARPNLA